MTDAAAFRAQFPVLERRAYLNAGTEGPVPNCTAQAVQDRLRLELETGRCGPDYFTPLMELRDRSRAGYAAVLGASPEEVALTGSTTDGVNTVLSGLDLRDGDEILTSDEEHPGLLAPLALAQRRRGVRVRVVPFAELGSAIGPDTRLVACSHVSWVSGRMVDSAALSASGVPVLLDAAQAFGAVPVDVKALGCAYYAASGQKWMCGPEGSGCLYVEPGRLDELEVAWPGYSSLADPAQALTSGPAEGVGRLDHGFPSGLRSTWALASMQVLADAGWDWVHERAATLAAGLADALAARDLTVGPRGRTTLVSWVAEDPAAEVERLAGHGIVVRSIPAFSMVRASVGAWSSEEELARLVELAAV
ncbi:MAG TPA: aminotransferase class V-fold PLP-dependent enzyme [Solirubrobacteraceae bacterium]|jgi:L-cysteine/cystine lyase|nr:aminotransferase class V-fold PLP-dependent enzyme [Solirubrobacteraceae bacterium]